MITPTLAISLAAGLAAQTAPAQDAPSRPNFARAVNIAQIHIDLGTGERTVSPWGTEPRGTSAPLWLNNNTDPCLTGELVYIMDDPDTDGDGQSDLFGQDCTGTPGGTLPCEGVWYNYWGDLHAPDAVVDRIIIRYGTSVPDVDLDSDGIGDGVPGFNLYLNFADRDNGFGGESVESGRLCIIELCLENLPGMVDPLPLGFIAVYELVIDLGQSTPSLVFELGDSDGIDDAGTGYSGGAIYGQPTFSDLDNIAGHDFSWGIRFDQSAIPQAQRGAAGVITASPKLGNPGDLPAHPADAQGTHIEPITYRTGPSCPPNVTILDWGTFFPYFSCEPWGDPYASSFIELYGSGGLPNECECDFAPPFFELDFSDVIAFLEAFEFCDPIADYAVPFGTCDFSDLVVFLNCFGTNCALP